MKIGKLDTAALGRPIVVAEMSANHLGRLERALEIIDAAAGSGADAVKIQTYRADTSCAFCRLRLRSLHLHA